MRYDLLSHPLPIEQLAWITDAIPALISFVDRDLRYRYCNRSYSEWFGLAGEQLIGRPMVEVLGPDAMRAVQPHLDRALGGEVADFEIEVSYKRAGKRWIHAIYTPHRNPEGVIVGLATLVTDVSERKRLESIVRRERERLSLALTAGSMGVYELNLLDQTLWWSREIYSVFGVDPESFAPTRETFTALIHPDDRDDWWRQLERSIATKQLFVHEFRIIRPDGAVRWIAHRGETDHDTKGMAIRHFGVAIDVTTGKTAADAIQRSEARLNAVLAHLREGVIILTTSPTTVYWNSAALEIHGHPSTEEYLLPVDQFQRIFEVWTADGTRRLENDEWPVRCIMRGETVENWELRLKRPDRNLERIILCSGKIVESSTGEKLVYLSVLDLTAQRRAEAALRSSEGRLRLFIEHAPAAIAMFDRDMRYMAASERWKHDFGLRDDIVGQSHYALFPDLPAHWCTVHERGLSGEIASAEADRFERANGSVQWVKWEVRPWYTDSGTIGGILIASEDVTERKNTEERIDEQRRVLKSVTDNATVALFITDEHQQCTFMNPAAERLTGFCLQEVQGKPLHDLIHHTRRDGSHYPLAECPIDRAFPENNDEKGEDSFIHKDGHFYDVAFTVSPIRESTGRPVGTVIEVRDITLEKQAAKELRESEERHRQLAEQLREANQRKDEFLAMLAHELRNPLAPIQTSAYLLQRIGANEPKIQRLSDVIARQVTHMSRLIDDLLDVSRITRGKIVLRYEPVDLSRLLENVVEDHRSSIENSGLRLRTSLPNVAVMVYGDKTRLAQVFGNLLHNAHKFTPTGGSIDVQLHCEGPQAIVQVTDTGIGMSPALIAQIFEPFVQAATSLDRSKGGLGLGLALAKGIIQLHGGQIRARSQGEGTGSTFEVQLKRMENE